MFYNLIQKTDYFKIEIFILATKDLQIKDSWWFFPPVLV